MSIIGQLVTGIGVPNFFALIPEIIILVFAFILLFTELFSKNRKLITAFTLTGLVLALLSTVVLILSYITAMFGTFEVSYLTNIMAYNFYEVTLYGLYVIDSFSLFFKLFLILSTLFIVVTYRPYFENKGIYFGEFYYLTLFALLGMMIMVSSPNLVTFYIGLELMSITIYILVGMYRTKREDLLDYDYKSKEGAFKYLIIGGVGTAVISYAIALLYGATGTFDFMEIAKIATNEEGINVGLLGGVVLLVVGLALKASAVPFHHWTPDAYEAAPTPITTFMAVTAKVATYAIILRVMVEALPYISEDWSFAWALLAAASMIGGNFIALRQKNVKRMLAYSSIAHTGYIIAALAAPTGMGMAAFIFYSLVYIFMAVGALIFLTAFEKNEGWTNHIDDFKGLAKQSPLMALLMLVFMFSMLGIPPTVGFMGKLGVFLALIGSEVFWLAVVLVIMSAISAGYYLRVVSVMYMYEPVKKFNFNITGAEKAVLILMAIIVLFLGIYPTVFWNFSINISSILMAGASG